MNRFLTLAFTTLLLSCVQLCFHSEANAQHDPKQCCRDCCECKFPINPCAPRLVQVYQSRRQAICRGRCISRRFGVCTRRCWNCPNTCCQNTCRCEDRNECYNCCDSRFPPGLMPGLNEMCRSDCDDPNVLIKCGTLLPGGRMFFRRCR